MKRNSIWLLSAILSAAYLWITYPYLEAYLQVPNRHLLPWDPAIHVKDGLLFYLQLGRFDFLSALYTLINLSFWMPLHPFLISITSIFFPFQYDAYVYVNFIALTAGLAWSYFLVFKSETFSWIQKAFISIGLFYFLLRIGNSSEFWRIHLSIMIESLAIGLTFVFAFSSLLEDIEPNRKFYTRSSIIALSLLFFTKVQYGLFYGAAYFAKHLYLERHSLLGRGRILHTVLRELLKKKIFFSILILFNLFGLFAVVTRDHFKYLGFGTPDGIWAIGFSGVLILTWIVKSKNAVIVQIRHQSSDFLKDGTRWLLLPFGWYYLLPFRHKVRWLLYNANSNSTETLSQKLTVLFSDLSAYLGTSLQGALLFVGLSFALSIWIWIKHKTLRTTVLYSWGLCFMFYFPMSLFAAARDPRFSVTWVVLFPVLILVWTALITRKKAIFIALGVAAMVGCISERMHFKTTEAVVFMKEHNFLSEDHQSISIALKEFDFSKPGVIYGLGNTMDLATILFDLEILKTHPEYSSVFSKREDRELVSNDFGRKGNQNPTQTILERATNPQVRQILLFKSGFKAEDFSKLSEELLNTLHFKAEIQTPHLELFRK